MKFEDMRRFLQGLGLPQGGFDDLLAELDRAEGRKTVARLSRPQPPATADRSRRPRAA